MKRLNPVNPTTFWPIYRQELALRPADRRAKMLQLYREQTGKQG